MKSTSHTFLVYKDKDNTWNWFENADFQNRGIHKFNNLDNVIDYQLTRYKQYLSVFNIKEEELEKIILKEYDKPKVNLTALEFIEYVTY